MTNMTLLPAKPDEIKAVLERMRRDMPSIIEHIKLMAEIRRVTYQAYIDQGFTPEQALELVKGDLA